VIDKRICVNGNNGRVYPNIFIKRTCFAFYFKLLISGRRSSRSSIIINFRRLRATDRPYFRIWRSWR